MRQHPGPLVLKVRAKEPGVPSRGLARRAWIARDEKARCLYGDERACRRYETTKRNAACEMAKRRYYYQGC